jgi:hypothetical protein
MFDIDESQRQAKARFARLSNRKRRTDAGRSRLPAPVLAELRAAALGRERPSMADMHRRIATHCGTQGFRAPSRSCLYHALSTLQGHTYAVSKLPAPVVEALYNLAPDGSVPGHQLAFYCFNYGTIAAVSFAAGLPWLDLYQASHLRGWRPRSRGLLAAVMCVRGIR